MKNKWQIAILLIAIGISCYIVNLMVYVPRLDAYQEALTTWIKTQMDGTMPDPQAFGLDNTAHTISGILGFAAPFLISIGIIYFAYTLFSRVALQLGWISKKSGSK
jgi:hypothetical protein